MLSWTPTLSRVHYSSPVGYIIALHIRSQLSGLDTIPLTQLVQRNMRHATIDALTVDTGDGIVVVVVAVFVLIECSNGVEMPVARFAELKEEAGRGGVLLSSRMSNSNKRDSSGQRTAYRAPAQDICTTGSLDRR